MGKTIFIIMIMVAPEVMCR